VLLCRQVLLPVHDRRRGELVRGVIQAAGKRDGAYLARRGGPATSRSGRTRAAAVSTL